MTRSVVALIKGRQELLGHYSVAANREIIWHHDGERIPTGIHRHNDDAICNSHIHELMVSFLYYPTTRCPVAWEAY